MYSGAAIWNSLPLHVKNATVNTFQCLYLKWKRLNNHCIMSITTANLILYFCTDLVNDSVFSIDLINAYFMSFILLA